MAYHRDPDGETRGPIIGELRDSTKRSIGIKLTVVARQLGQRFDQNVEQIGLSRAKFSVIAMLSRYPGATQRAVAEMLQVTEVTAGRLIERLCADGYLERRENPNDRRAHCVYLTEAAQPVLKTLGDLATRHEEETFAGMSEAELETLERLLAKIQDNIAPMRAKLRVAGSPEDCDAVAAAAPRG